MMQPYVNDPQKQYVAYYKTSEDKDDIDVVGTPSNQTVAYPNTMNKNTDDHMMTGGISGD